jgi:hypothetical protein
VPSSLLPHHAERVGQFSTLGWPSIEAHFRFQPAECHTPKFEILECD